MGFSLKSFGNLVGKAAGASLGAYLGGPTGAVAGYNGADAVLGAVGLGSDQLAAEQEFKYAKKAADYAFGKNLEMWNLANAYNDPAAQMERLQKAGLNPNLVYGGGNVTGNSSASIPSYDTPNVNYTDRSTQRQQLAMALIDHQQKITNQAIENDLARQRLVLQERDADRSDALAKAQIDAYKMNFGLTSENNMLNNSYRRDALAFKRYQSDLSAWLQRVENYKHEHKYATSADAEARAGRRPMYMDYLD